MRKPLSQRIQEKYREIKQLQADNAPAAKLQGAFYSLRHLQRMAQQDHRISEEQIAELEEQIHAQSPPLDLDLHIFGNSPAAVILANKLKHEYRDPDLAKRVVRFIQRTQTGFSRLSEIADDGWFKTFRLMWRNQQLDAIDFHPELDTYVANVVSTDAKEWLRSTYSPKRLAKMSPLPKMDRNGNLIC